MDLSAFMDVITTFKCKACEFSCGKQEELINHVHDVHLPSVEETEDDALAQEEIGDHTSVLTIEEKSTESNDLDVDIPAAALMQSLNSQPVMEEQQQISIDTPTNVSIETQDGVPIEAQDGVPIEAQDGGTLQTQDNQALQAQNDEVLQAQDENSMEAQTVVSMGVQDGVTMETQVSMATQLPVVSLPMDVNEQSMSGGHSRELQQVAIQTFDEHGHPTEQVVYVEGTSARQTVSTESMADRELFLCGQCTAGFSTIDECKEHMVSDHDVPISELPSSTSDITVNMVDDLMRQVGSEAVQTDEMTNNEQEKEPEATEQVGETIAEREVMPDGKISMSTQVIRKRPGRKSKKEMAEIAAREAEQRQRKAERAAHKEQRQLSEEIITEVVSGQVVVKQLVDGAESDDELVDTQYVTVEIAGKRSRRPPKHLTQDYVVPRKNVKREILIPEEKIERKQKSRELKLKTLGTFTIKCPEPNCRAKFETETSLDYHTKTHKPQSNGTMSYLCPEESCNNLYWTNSWCDFKLHAWKRHKIDLDMIPCDQCGYKATLPSKLFVHKEIHSKDKPYACDICHKCFKQQSQLKNHQVMHTIPVDVTEKQSMSGRHWFVQSQCYVCKRTFANQKSLACHIEAVHDKIKPYKCSYCGHTAARKAMMELHIRTHTGEKPFQCSICPYQTGDHNSMRRHRMRHSGDKPYKCPHCPYACIQAVSLKLHLKSKHPGSDSVYTCGKCTYKTVNKTLYTNHARDHDMGLIEEVEEPVQHNTVITRQSGVPLRLGSINDLTDGTTNATNLIISALNAIAPSLIEGDEGLPDNIETSIQTVQNTGTTKSHKIVFHIPATATRSAKAAEVVVQEQSNPIPSIPIEAVNMDQQPSYPQRTLAEQVVQNMVPEPTDLDHIGTEQIIEQELS